MDDQTFGSDVIRLRLKDAQQRLAWALLAAALIALPVWWLRAVEPFVRLATPVAELILVAGAIAFRAARLKTEQVGRLLFGVMAVLLIGAFTTGLLGQARGLRDFEATAYAAVRIQGILVGGAYVAFGPRMARRWTFALLSVWLYGTLAVLRLDGNQEMLDALPTVGEILLSTGIVILLFDVSATTARNLATGERQARRAARLAYIDPLTGLPNRRGIEPALNRAARDIDRGSIIMIDVDHFKSLNDTFGHAAGDQVLERLADVLRHHTRGTDRVARWGGEEFIVVLPEGGEQGSLLLAERIRTSVHAIEAPKPITVSLGLAVARVDDTVATILERADACLYTAKGGGRDCMVAAWTPDVIRRGDDEVVEDREHDRQLVPTA